MMMSFQRTLFFFAVLTLALIGYYAPWYTHKTAGFTMNAFDLAEWSSLHPAVRSKSPELLTTLLLRLPHLMITAALALAANGLRETRLRWIMRGVALILALRMVPPTDFFRAASDDPNYRQMALLTVIGVLLIVAALPLSRLPKRGQMWLIAALAVVGSGAGWNGLSRTDILMDNFEINVRIGPGIILYTLAAVLLIGGAAWGDGALPQRLGRRSALASASGGK